MSGDPLPAKLIFKFPFVGREGIHYEYELEPELFLALARAGIFIASQPAHFEENFEMVYQLARLGTFLDRGYVLQPLNDHIADMVFQFVGLAEEQEWKDAREPVMLMCYILLARKEITRMEAFKLAVRLLGPNAPKSANSWRVRVDAYAKEQGLTPIGQPIRKSRTS